MESKLTGSVSPKTTVKSLLGEWGNYNFMIIWWEALRFSSVGTKTVDLWVEYCVTFQSGCCEHNNFYSNLHELIQSR